VVAVGAHRTGGARLRSGLTVPDCAAIETTLPGDRGRGTGGKEHEFGMGPPQLAGPFFCGSRFVISPDDPSTGCSTEPRMAEREQRGAQPISHAGAGIAVTFQRAFMGRTNIWPG
jgi:hypothetical protein